MRVALLLGILFSSLMCTGKENIEPLFLIAYPSAAKFSDKTCDMFLSKETKPGYINICMDAVLELEFEVGEVLYGTYKRETINAIDFVHSGGFPRYLTETSIYMVLVKSKGTYFLSKTAFLRDVGNDEWICGKNLNPFTKDSSPKAPPYSTSKVSDCVQGVNIEVMKHYLKSIEKAGAIN